MRFYLEKPIRVDYYPKTSENTDEPERLEIEDNLDGEAACEVADEEKSVGGETMEYGDCIEKDAEIMEGTIKEVTGDMEKVMKKVAKGKK